MLEVSGDQHKRLSYIRMARTITNQKGTIATNVIGPEAGQCEIDYGKDKRGCKNNHEPKVLSTPFRVDF